MEINTITLLPVSGNQDYVYNFGDVQATIALDHKASVSDDYLMVIYSDRLIHMARAKTRNIEDVVPLPANNVVKRSGKKLKAVLHSSLVWIPGNYFLIVRSDNTGELWRFDLTLDDHCTFHVTGSRECERYGAEDMLSGRTFEPSFDAMRCLMSRPGMKRLREWGIKRAQETAFNNFRVEQGGEKMTFNNNLLVVAPGTVSQLGYSAIEGLLYSTSDIADVAKADCAKLFDRTTPNPYEKLNDFFIDRIHFRYDAMMDDKKDYQVGMLLYNVWALCGGDGRIIMNKLLDCWPSKMYALTFYGTAQEIDNLLEQNPSLRGYFPEYNRIEQDPPTAEELMQEFFWEVGKAQLQLSPAATDKVCHIIAQAGARGLIANWNLNDLHRYVHDTLQHGYCRNAVTLLQKGGVFPSNEVGPEDIDPEDLLPHQVSLEGLFQELDTLVGLGNIKQHILTLANRVRFDSERRRLGLPVCEGGSYHAIFTGNPGTGKTTVAKMMGRVFHALGLLSKGEVICVDRAKMVGEYIGQTEQIMKHILAEARGNVLFVDEAYTLYRKDNDRDVGRIAIESLLGVLSSKNPDMIIIFAGYKHDMDELLSMNDGLEGRFPYKIHFDDYNAEQLMQIALGILDQSQFVLTPDAEVLLRQTIVHAASRQDNKFSNARWVNQLVCNGIIPAMSDRLMSSVHVFDQAAYQTIQAIDVKTACAKFDTVPVLPSRNVVGFRTWPSRETVNPAKRQA